MTFYKKLIVNGMPVITGSIEKDVKDIDTLEETALTLRRVRNRIDTLNLHYENTQETLIQIQKEQKEASKVYKELKEKLVKLAEEDFSDDDQ